MTGRIRSSAAGAAAVGMSPPVAAIIVSHNAARHLASLLASLASSEPVRSIIVVDNGSDDASAGLARATPGVTVIEQHNTGYAHGVNRGVAAAPARADILVLNPDLALREGAVEALVRALSVTVDAGVVVPLLRDAEGAVTRSLRRAPSVTRTLVEALVGGTRSGRYGESFSPDVDAGVQATDWATGAAMLLRRSALDRVGPFDESFFLYSEETEYCLRLPAIGLRVVCEPAAVAVHTGGEMSRDHRLWSLRAVNRVRLYGRSAGPVRSAAFRIASMMFEARRVITGDGVSRAALRALCSRDLDAEAIRLTIELGGDPTPMRSATARRPRSRRSGRW